MFSIFFICFLAFIFGALTGKLLSVRGIRADKSLMEYHRSILLGLIAVALVIFSLLVLDWLNLVDFISAIFPQSILLYLGEYFTQSVLAGSFFILGLLILLELPGIRSPKRMRELCVAIVAVVPFLLVLVHFSLPVIDLVGKPKIANGVVLQTTPYTCAPASIATLARFYGNRPDISERDVVEIANTDRFGTRTLSEIKAMKKLGLQPVYKQGLTLENLLEIGKPALLHVREKDPNNGQYISHAVALLSINPEKELIAIGNPLYGIQIKTFKQMKNYWKKEAIFITPKQ